MFGNRTRPGPCLWKRRRVGWLAPWNSVSVVTAFIINGLQRIADRTAKCLDLLLAPRQGATTRRLERASGLVRLARKSPTEIAGDILNTAPVLRAIKH